MSDSYIVPTPESINTLFSHQIEGELVMLNLLRFRQLADYSGSPELAPDKPLSGRGRLPKIHGARKAISRKPWRQSHVHGRRRRFSNWPRRRTMGSGFACSTTIIGRFQSVYQ